ncbi:hypothetical protein MTBSS4_190002 [Magnetospirillum sp. SS-4]|nr:hypothetical protein MTBSS4_190002 [Magnetospirillum sp. SS-4]
MPISRWSWSDEAPNDHVWCDDHPDGVITTSEKICVPGTWMIVKYLAVSHVRGKWKALRQLIRAQLRELRTETSMRYCPYVTMMTLILLLPQY